MLPQALFVAAQRWPGEPFMEAAEASFAFLDQVTTARLPPMPDASPDSCVFWPVGNQNWYPHGGEKSLFDQQPIEAGTMADAALTAYLVSGNDGYLEVFRRAAGWFHGQNCLGLPVADRRTGACCDGLHAAGLNRNQGAESTLAFLSTEMLATSLGAGSNAARRASA